MPENIGNFNTNQLKNIDSFVKPRILLAPLDWGLGHTSRCIPIVSELLNQGAEVFVAGTNVQKEVFLTEFPEINFIPLSGYNITYAATKAGLYRRIFQQLPQILASIKREHNWLQSMLAKYAFDAIISDNRFGLYAAQVPCVFITHQLGIKTPFQWVDRLVQNRNYTYINHFCECWVPDVAEGEGIAGNLSHPFRWPAVPVTYIGLLSRFKQKSVEQESDRLLIILSGPEPQRTILENKIIQELSFYEGMADVVRGLPGTETVIPSTNRLCFYNHLSAAELNDKIVRSSFVVSRCGYSTVMDLVKLRKKSILIPTPGQTEQEYLADYLVKKKMAVCINQQEFSLKRDLLKAGMFNYHFPFLEENLLQKTISNFLLNLKKC